MTGDRVSRNAGFALATQLLSAAMTAALMLFLGRALSRDGYGDFAFALSVVTLATLFADLGISSAAGRFLAERVDEPAAAAAVFRTSLRLKLALAGATTAALVVLAGPLCRAFGLPGATWAVRGAALALLGQSMFLLLLGTFVALRQVRFNVVIVGIESVVELVASVGLVLLGAGAAGAAFGRAAGYLVGLAVALVVIRRVLGPRLGAASASPPVGWRRILGYAGPLVLVSAAFRVFSSIDVLLVTALLGGAHVAAFDLPMRLTVVLEYPAAAVAAAVAPRLARRAGAEPDTALFAAALRYLAMLQVVLIPPLLVWPEAIIHLLFGDRYPDAAGVLRALAPYVLFCAIAQLATLGVDYLGEARRRVPLAVGMLALNAAIDVVLLPRIGVVAAAIGTSAAYALWVPGHLWILRRRAGLALRPLAGTLVRVGVAGLAMAAVLALLGVGEVPLWRLAVGAVLGPAVYVLVLIGLREVRLADVQQLHRVVAARNVTA